MNTKSDDESATSSSDEDYGEFSDDGSTSSEGGEDQMETAPPPQPVFEKPAPSRKREEPPQEVKVPPKKRKRDAPKPKPGDMFVGEKLSQVVQDVLPGSKLKSAVDTTVVLMTNKEAQESKASPTWHVNSIVVQDASGQLKKAYLTVDARGSVKLFPIQEDRIIAALLKTVPSDRRQAVITTILSKERSPEFEDAYDWNLFPETIDLLKKKLTKRKPTAKQSEPKKKEAEKPPPQPKVPTKETEKTPTPQKPTVAVHVATPPRPKRAPSQQKKTDPAGVPASTLENYLSSDLFNDTPRTVDVKLTLPLEKASAIMALVHKTLYE